MRRLFEGRWCFGNHDHDRTTLNIMSLMGFLMMAGIVVSNSILIAELPII